MLECVVNVSEGRHAALLEHLAETARPDLLDIHHDAHHHRAVLTLLGELAPRRVASAAVVGIDLRRHLGAHPRLGAIDVVPFVPLDGSTMADAVTARDEFMRWAADVLTLPSFAYGEERNLPAVRAGAFKILRPDAGPDGPHPTAGAVAVGARPVLVAYNVWLADADVATARRIARDLRGPAVRALGLAVGGRAQVSMNLVDPAVVGPADVYDAVAARASVAGAELVGLVPASVLERVPEDRWAELDLTTERTIEARRQACGR